MNTEPVKAETLIDATPTIVWNALTDNDEMKEWYFKLERFEPVVGFTFRFEGGNEHRTYWHICTITEVILQHKLVHTWQFEGYPGNSSVTWWLHDEGNKTRVQLTHEGLETFPADQPDFAKHNFEEGWKYIVESSLKHYAEGKAGTAQQPA